MFNVDVDFLVFYIKIKLNVWPDKFLPLKQWIQIHFGAPSYGFYIWLISTESGKCTSTSELATWQQR